MVGGVIGARARLPFALKAHIHMQRLLASGRRARESIVEGAFWHRSGPKDGVE